MDTVTTPQRHTPPNAPTRPPGSVRSPLPTALRLHTSTGRLSTPAHSAMHEDITAWARGVRGQVAHPVSRSRSPRVGGVAKTETHSGQLPPQTRQRDPRTTGCGYLEPQGRCSQA